MRRRTPVVRFALCGNGTAGEAVLSNRRGLSDPVFQCRCDALGYRRGIDAEPPAKRSKVGYTIGTDIEFTVSEIPSLH